MSTNPFEPAREDAETTPGTFIPDLVAPRDEDPAESPQELPAMPGVLEVQPAPHRYAPGR
jgi:ribose 5-phosphate isomerase